MPLGWYLAQGLYPLGPSSSDDEEGPCELPDGRIVCGPHGRVICGRCCTDYTGLTGDGEEEEDEDELDAKLEAETQEMYNQLSPESRAEVDARWGRLNSTARSSNDQPSTAGTTAASANRQSASDVVQPWKRVPSRGTGRVFPTKFFPPSDTITPPELFSGRAKFGGLTRITHRNDSTKLFISTDGACLNNGQPNPKAGWAFLHGINQSGQPLIARARLEKKGPFGDDSVQSSNRAELRAVIAALGFRYWSAEGFESVVIATDSSYVVDGATKWTKTWVKNGWQTNDKADVKNKDLWEMLLGEVERAKDDGLTIHLWHIPREWNTVADAAAKEAAAEDKVQDTWTRMMGLDNTV